MFLKYVDKSLEKEWENLVKSNPASGYMQSFFWTEFKSLLGWDNYKVGIFEGKRLVGGAVVSKYNHYKDFNFISISEGPVLPYNNKESEKMFYTLISSIDSIVDLKGDKLTAHLSIEPKLNFLPKYFFGFQKAVTDQQPIKTLLINLSLSEEDILEQMKPKGRYNIRVAQKHNVKVFQSDFKENLVDFLSLYHSFTKRQNVNEKNDDYFEKLAFILDKYKIGKTYFAVLDQKILATALIVYYGSTATYLFGASSEDKRNVMAPYLLHWQVIKDAKKNGLKWYDFYSLNPEDKNPNHPWEGFSVFKKKFGGKVVDYIGAYDFVYNKKAYKQYLKESAKD